MRSFSFLTVVLSMVLLTVTGCKKATYRKSPGGMPYLLYKSKDSTAIRPGNFVKLSFTQKVNDSVYYTNVGKPPFYSPISNQPAAYDLAELWSSLHKGDSIVTVQMMDTFLNRNPGQLPPQFKKGDKITTYVKVIDVFRNAAEAMKDEEETKKQYAVTEIAEIEKYLEKEKISAIRTPSGAFISIMSEGTGPEVDTGKYVLVNYTGTSFSGKRFDSNTDTSFHHVEPYGFVAGTSAMIRGFDEAVLMMKKGSVAKVYIPSMLGYGGNTGNPNIKPYEHLIFDLEIVDVQDKAPQRRENMPPATDSHGH